MREEHGAQKTLKVLVVDEEVPFPPDAGKRVRTWNLLKRLAQKHQVHLLCYGRMEDPASAALESAGIVLHLVKPLPNRHGASLYWRLLANVFSPYPFSVAKHYSQRFQRAFKDLLKSESWDLVQCEWTPYARFLPASGNTPTLIATHNVESQIWERRAEHCSSLIGKVFFSLQARKMHWFERRALLRATAVTAVTLADAQTMRSWGVQNVTVVSNGVDPDLYVPAREPENDNEILSVASLDWFPNTDALEYFVREVFPSIREQLPKAVFRIVGRRPPESLRERLSRIPGVDFVGAAEDVRPYLDRAAVVVVPLRIGGGSRLKILEALAAGKAVVSTSVGAEGLELETDKHLRIADSPSDFAQSVVELLESGEKRRRLGKNGRELAATRYGWDGISGQLECAWLDLARRSHSREPFGAAIHESIGNAVNRPRILHLRASNFVGGPESQLLRSATIDEHGPWEVLFGVYVGLYEGRAFRDAIKDLGLEVISFPMGSLASSVRDLVHVLREKQIGLICTHGYKADIVGLLAGRACGIPVACFLRGWTGENRRVRLYETLDRFCLRFADRVVCLSDAQAGRISRSSLLSKKIRVVTNAIDVPEVNLSSRSQARKELQKRFKLADGCVLIATAGRLSPEKGVGDFLDAAAQVKQHAPLARFLIFGSGPLKHELKRRAAALGLQDQVTFAGFQRDLRNLLPGLDILVNASHSEEMPNIVLEGMAAGIPVIATAVGGVDEIAGPQCAVRLVPPRNPAAQAEAILELLKQPQRAAELAGAGRERVAQTFSVETQKDQLQALYREFLPSAASPDRARSPVALVNSSENSMTTGRQRPFLSIVLPVRNEEAGIGAALGQLASQQYPHDRIEILVADGRSTDRTLQVVAEFAERSPIPVRMLDNPLRLSSAGRNVGARKALGDYIFYIDGHCHIPSTTLLSDAVALFEKTRADCLCRPQPLDMEGNSLFQSAVAHVRATRLGHGTDSTIYDVQREGPVNPTSAGALYRRDVFDRIGYYDERFDACEDVEFNYRVFKAGLLSYMSPQLTVRYHPRANVLMLWKQMVRYGRGRLRLIRKHPDAFSFSQAVPAAFLIWLVLGTVASFFSVPLAAFFGLTLAVYGAAVGYFSVALGSRYGWSHLVFGPMIYLTIHLGVGAGFLLEALRFTSDRDRSFSGEVSSPSAT